MTDNAMERKCRFAMIMEAGNSIGIVILIAARMVNAWSVHRLTGITMIQKQVALNCKPGYVDFPNCHLDCSDHGTWTGSSCDCNDGFAQPNCETCENGYSGSNCEPATWIDTTTGLTWQNPPAENRMNWLQAKNYCDSMVFAGFDDWHLPTISELRSLIRGCTQTQVGGSCNVEDDGCLTWDYRDSEECGDCGNIQGPGNNGCYWSEYLRGDCSEYWAMQSWVDAFDDEMAWTVVFYTGKVTLDTVNLSYDVRCVR